MSWSTNRIYSRRMIGLQVKDYLVSKDALSKDSSIELPKELLDLLNDSNPVDSLQFNPYPYIKTEENKYWVNIDEFNVFSKKIDRRWIYALIFFIVFFCIFFGIPLILIALSII